MTDVKVYLDEAEEKMQMAEMYLDEQLSRIRAMYTFLMASV